MIQYFVDHRDSLKINERLLKFSMIDIPIIDKEAEPRVEEINPTPKKDYYGGQGNGSGPASRKESANFRKTSFNKRHNDSEYVVKDEDK